MLESPASGVCCPVPFGLESHLVHGHVCGSWSAISCIHRQVIWQTLSTWVSKMWSTVHLSRSALPETTCYDLGRNQTFNSRETAAPYS